jgi:hypothetical protein
MAGEDWTFKDFVVERLAPIASILGALAYIAGFFVQFQEQASKLGFRAFAVAVSLTFAYLVWYTLTAKRRSANPLEQVPRFGWLARSLAVAALVFSLVPLAIAMYPKEDLRVLDISSAKLNDRCGIDIVVQNVSKVRQPLTGLEFAFQQETQLAQIGYTVYEIDDASFEADNQTITGAATIAGDASRVALPVKGSFVLHDRGAWALGFKMLLREDLQPGASQRLVIGLPRTIKLGKKSSFSPLSLLSPVAPVPERTPDVFTKHTTCQFLGLSGRTSLALQFSYADSETFKHRGAVSFKNP